MKILSAVLLAFAVTALHAEETPLPIARIAEVLAKSIEVIKPGAKVFVDKSDDLIIQWDVREFMLHHQGRMGDWSEKAEKGIGPAMTGCHMSFNIQRGAYLGALVRSNGPHFDPENAYREPYFLGSYSLLKLKNANAQVNILFGTASDAKLLRAVYNEAVRVITNEIGADTDIARALEKIRAKHKLPALGAAVLVDGKLVALKTVGVRKIGDPTPVSDDDKFHLGSCTKSMTGLLAALLIDEGKIRWDSTLAQSFPELSEKMSPQLRGVTLDQFLAHRSGLAADDSIASVPAILEYSAAKWPGTMLQKREHLVKMLSEQKPAHAPGEKFVYSNPNYLFAAAMLERAANRSWEELIAERIFAPLEMRSAGLGSMGTPGSPPNQPWQHRVSEAGQVTAVEPGPDSDNPAMFSPAGRVHCSLADWANYAAEYCRAVKGESRLKLKAEAWKKFYTPAPNEDYVAGWNVTRRDWATGPVLTHAGSNTMNYAVIWLAPLDGFAVLVVTNQAGKEAEKAVDEVSAAMIRQFKGPKK